jgi:integrase
MITSSEHTRRRTFEPSPRMAMRILRHAQIDVTMNVYTEVSDAKTLQALKRLGRQLGS